MLLIFMYAVTKSNNPKEDTETLDLQIYRKAEIKSRQMGKIEYIIKRNAVDCNFNRDGNIFENDVDYVKSVIMKNAIIHVALIYLVIYLQNN